VNLAQLVFRICLGRRLPIASGTLTVPGIGRPVHIRRDRWGIPYIKAANDVDAWYGLGFCHGQDRSFQLELLLRVTRGTLAEWLGARALPVDRLARRIGFLDAARRQLDVLEPDLRAMLAAYAAGTSAGATLGLPRPAHEFALLRGRPTSWTPADVLALVKLQSFALASNWDMELARLKILTEDGPEALAALDLAYPEWLPVAAPPGALAGRALDRLAEDLAVFTAVVRVGGGSNNWALGPSRTATGRPLLANDPHLPPGLPSQWYLAHVSTPEWAAAGASYVGGPGILAGHNGFAAWGLTAGLVDNTDLFLEQIGPDGRSVRQGDGFVPCAVRAESIAVRGGAAVTEEVLLTPRGPLVGPALAGEVGAVSLRAVWLDPRPLGGMLRLHRARSFEEFRQCMAQWPALSANLVYADATEKVGWQLAGEAPRRRRGWGLLPQPGWDPGVGWEHEPVPFAEMPHLADPPGGFVATANARPQPEGQGPYLGADWIDGYRLARIVQVLQTRHDWDVVGCQALQMDQHAIPWTEIREAVLAAPAADPDVRAALDLLGPWDGGLTVDAAAATVYELFVAALAERVCRAKAPRSYQWALGQGFSPLFAHSGFAVRRLGHLVGLLREQPPGWFARPWPAEVADVLGGVVRRLRAERGADPARWGWGRVRPLTLRHPLGERRVFERVLNLGPIPWGGDAKTPSQASAPPDDPLGNPAFVATLRLVIDVGAWNNSRFVLAGGQSGNPLSPHYADQFPLWQRGEGVPIAWTEEEVRQAACATLELLPDGAGTAEAGRTTRESR
jgi:penicillin amidase